MNNMVDQKIIIRLYRSLFLVALLTLPGVASAQNPATQEHVAAFKQSLAKNKAALKKYQWVETTTVSLKGDVKSVKQNASYYGADGKVQKTPIGEPAAAPAPQPSGRRGRLRGAIVAKKKEELTEYMKEAVALVGQYIPPDPELIKYSKEMNNIKVEQIVPNKLIRLSIPNFYKKGDLLSATLDLVTNSIVDVNISSFLETEKDKITLSVVFSQLNDGTNFAGKTTLNAPEKNIVVVVENSGYRPL